MDNQEHNTTPREVVLEYHQPDYREVVEQYSCPLPKPRRVQAEPAVLPLKQRRRKGLRIFLLLTLLVVVLVGVGLATNQVRLYWEKDFRGSMPGNGFGFDMEDFVTDTDWENEEVYLPTVKPDPDVRLEVHRTHGETLTAQEVYKQVNPAVVSVVVDLERGVGMGTGVIFRQDGYIVTNYHVVAGSKDCTILLENGYSYPAKYVGGDPQRDLAVLKMEQTDLPAAVFGDSDLLEVGDAVYAIGSPLSLELRGTLTDGIVSAVDRTMEMAGGGSLDFIQTNAALNEGNSGGPLINEYGQVVGINVIKMKMRSSNVAVEGLGFAIPSAEMKRLINDILVYGEVQPEPLLGLMVMNVSEQLDDDLWGAEVESVTKGSAADRAGMQAGDFIISVGETEPILGSKDVLRARQAYHVGDQMSLKLWRDGEIVEVVLDLQEAVDTD